MKFISVIVIFLIGIVIIFYEGRKIKRNQKKEKFIVVILTASGVVLASLLVYFPELPGPTQMVEGIFGSLGKLLE